MKTQVLNIQQCNNTDSLIVFMSIGQEQYSFKFARFFEHIGNRQLQIITYDDDFGEIFKFNQHIVAEVMNLVRQIYRGEGVELPIVVGDFGTFEEALTSQKPFKGENLVFNG